MKGLEVKIWETLLNTVVKTTGMNKGFSPIPPISVDSCPSVFQVDNIMI